MRTDASRPFGRKVQGRVYYHVMLRQAQAARIPFRQGAQPFLTHLNAGT